MIVDRTPPETPIACSYRSPVRDADGKNGVAVCRLLQEMTRLDDARLCHVSEDACLACCREKRPGREGVNPVVASFLHRVSDQVIQAGGLPDCTVQEAVALKARAFADLKWMQGGKPVSARRISPASPRHYTCRGRIYSCDVLICCSDSTAHTERALRSVLDQASAVTQVHLVDNGGGGRELAERYGSSGNVTVHRNPVAKSPLATAHDLVDRMGTEFFAIQDPRTVSRPERVAYSVGILEELGGDILGAGSPNAVGDVFSREPSDVYARYLAPETLVIRRACFVDMGGVADRRDGDEDAEFVYRAFRERRSILLAPEVTVHKQVEYQHAAVGVLPMCELRNGTLRHCARDFPMKRVACDVVLPFWSQMEHVRQALEGLLVQENADVLVHLVDDGSPEDTESFLRHWSTHPQVRAYRNLRNISQFTSFNNVSAFLETDLVAVQDGDDISLPGRISLAGNTLRLSDASIFGSAVVILDSGEPQCDEGWGHLMSDIRVRRWNNLGISAWPTPKVYWFLFNPSMVLTRDVFRRLGGFGDYGTSVRNRCGHDIEFCLRAYHCGVRFAISRQPTVLYRQHAEQTTRSAVTGFGTEHEVATSQEARRRGDIYRRMKFDPVAFGALGKYQHLTQRFENGIRRD